jgi:hypothetical protein
MHNSGKIYCLNIFSHKLVTMTRTLCWDMASLTILKDVTKPHDVASQFSRQLLRFQPVKLYCGTSYNHWRHLERTRISHARKQSTLPAPTLTQLAPLKRTSFKVSNSVDVFLQSSEGGKRSNFLKRCFLKFLEFRMMDRSQNPSNSDCSTPL